MNGTKKASVETQPVIIKPLDLTQRSQARAIYALVATNRSYFEKFEGIPAGAYADIDAIMNHARDWPSIKRWGIYQGDGLTLAGYVSLVPQGSRVGRIGYNVAEEFAGRKLATEALIRVLKEKENVRDYDVFQAVVDDDHVVSQQVLKNAGFVYKTSSPDTERQKMEMIFEYQVKK